jgi:hypothetical protein
MSSKRLDTFALVVNFTNDYWVLRHVTIGLFEASNTSCAALAEIVKPILAKFELMNQILECVNDEG